MRVFVSADIEGVTGVTSWDETEQGKICYEEAVRQMTAEVSAACEVCISNGYDVVVRDAHDSAMNLYANQLPKGVQLIRGWMETPFTMMEGVDETFQAALYIGYHAPAATDYNPLAHTMSSARYQWVSVNGVLASEFSLNAMIAASYHVPSIFLSGDSGICDLAKSEVPEIVTVATKQGFGSATWNRHPEDVLQDIREGVRFALTENIPCPKIEEKYVLQICFKEHRNAEFSAWYPGAKRIDSHTVEYMAKSPQEMLVAMMFMKGN